MHNMYLVLLQLAFQVQVWKADMKRAISTGKMSAGESSRLTGRLSFAAQHVFKRLGRAMLVPFYLHTTRKRYRPEMDHQLIMALSWWLEVLDKGICEVRTWKENKQRPVQLLCDARSTPPRVAAVCICDGVIEYADGPPTERMMEQFKVRNDNQIASLEMLAIALGESCASLLQLCLYSINLYLCPGLSAFKDKLRGRNVVVHTDNTIAENGVKKGRSKSFDHACVVHCIWYVSINLAITMLQFFSVFVRRSMALDLGAALYIKRVPTKENLADDPSRERYGLLQRMQVGSDQFFS